MQLRTSDLAACTGLNSSAVRYYDERGLLRPAYRKEENQYRFYDPRQIPQFHLLKALQRLGFTTEELLEFGRSRTPENALALFRDCGDRLDAEIAELRAWKDMLGSYASLIREGQAAPPGKIAKRVLPARPMRFSPLGDDGDLRRAHTQIRENGNGSCPLGFCYEDFFELLEHPDRPAQLVSYDPQGPETRPAGEYLVGTAACGYGETGGLPRRMFDYALRHGLDFTGPVYMIHLIDTASAADPDRYLLQISAAVQSAAARE